MTLENIDSVPQPELPESHSWLFVRTDEKGEGYLIDQSNREAVGYLPPMETIQSTLHVRPYQWRRAHWEHNQLPGDESAAEQKIELTDVLDALPEEYREWAIRRTRSARDWYEAHPTAYPKTEGAQHMAKVLTEELEAVGY